MLCATRLTVPDPDRAGRRHRNGHLPPRACLRPGSISSLPFRCWLPGRLRTALGRGGLPAEAGSPPDGELLRRRVLGPLTAEWTVYLGTAAAIVVFALLVSGFAPLTPDNRPLTIVPDSAIDRIQSTGGPVMQVLGVLVREVSRPAGLVLVLSGVLARLPCV